MDKRYTLRDIAFGLPPKICEDGDWIKYEDHESKLNSLKRQYNEVLLHYKDLDEAFRDMIKLSNDRLLNWQVFTFLEGIVIMILGILLFVK